MDARQPRPLIWSLVLLGALASLGASYRTTNFIIQAPTPDLAKQIGDAAETYRRELAIEWLGNELPSWQNPCPITAHVHPQLGAGGVTSFRFRRGVPYDWKMEVTGSHERILDSVLPHEVTHTIFATHFGCPLPRWADEGACTTVEHASEKAKQDQWLIHFLKNGKGIPFRHLYAMRDYPEEMLPLYAQGYSLTRFLIQQGGRRKFIRYVEDGIKTNDWVAATGKHYGYSTLGELQLTWLDWVKQGSPIVSPTDPPRMDLASHNTPAAATDLPATGSAVGRSPGAQGPSPEALAMAPTPAGPQDSGRSIPTAVAPVVPQSPGPSQPQPGLDGRTGGQMSAAGSGTGPSRPQIAAEASGNLARPSADDSRAATVPASIPPGYDSWYAAVRDRRVATPAGISSGSSPAVQSEVVMEWSDTPGVRR